MRAIYFYGALLFLFCFLSEKSFSQTSYSNLFYNNGDVVYVQSGAVLHVQGDVVNASGAASNFVNNGLLNVEGDFTSNGTFKIDGSVGEGTVRMIGGSTVAGSATSGVQTISGSLTDERTASFYNLVIDRESAGQVVALGSNVVVTGSLVWNDVNGTTSAATYSPSSFSSTIGNTTNMKVRGATRTGNGLIQMYTGTNDYGLYLTNGANNAVAGYQALGSYSYSGTSGGSAVKAANDQYAQSRGADGATTGLSQLIQGSGTFVFPVGTPTLYYNPIELNFPSSQTDLQLTCKFTENSTLTAGSTQVFSNYIDQTHSISPATTSAYIAAHPDFTDNPGFNIYQKATCSQDSGWFIMDQFVKNHGYWSMNVGSTGGLSTGTGTLNGTYSIQAFPHGYTDWSVPGSTSGPNKRLVKEDIDGFTGTPSASNFQTQVESNINSYGDFITYSYLGTGHGSFASCNDATGIPGGAYTSFSHFAVGTSSSPTGQALPVTLIGLNADPINNAYIRVSWATASELDNKGFEIQRSTDGATFKTIGWTDGNGSTTEQHNYEYNDNNVIANTTYYYRLNQVDVDGHGALTNTVSAMITDGPNVTISDFQPNPTNGSARLVISTTEAQPVTVKFYDILGKLIIDSENNQVAYGTNTFDFNMSTLSAATYTAVIRIGANVYTKKIVLVK